MLRQPRGASYPAERGQQVFGFTVSHGLSGRANFFFETFFFSGIRLFYYGYEMVVVEFCFFTWQRCYVGWACIGHVMLFLRVVRFCDTKNFVLVAVTHSSIVLVGP